MDDFSTVWVDRWGEMVAVGPLTFATGLTWARFSAGSVRNLNKKSGQKFGKGCESDRYAAR